MTHAALALQQAMFDMLSQDADLIALLGGAHIFDDVPRQQKPPYIVFAEALHSDWSTGTEPGLEHAVTLEVWSPQKGRRQALEISLAAETALGSLPNILGDHQLINFAHEFTEVNRDDETDYFRAKLQFRAVSEPL